MAEMFVVTEANQDDMSRKAGIFLYCDTKLWLEGNVVHRDDGPAIISPDGVERWYLSGADMTRQVKAFFSANKWPLAPGLNDDDKKARFAAEFLR
ncbi:aldehyde dehydrogenase [Xanthobacter sp. KR7-65]|uniref:aldehyde dehydrogenase n=1 Tax=Xanthobacter sp. KR7-65 TaxID=3156612 RepID=UPI0032B494C1